VGESMTLDARLHRLEEALHAGPNQRIEQEHQARTQFAVKLFVWRQHVDLPEEWRVALEQATQAVATLPPLPQHPCAPSPRMEPEDRAKIDQFLSLPASITCHGRFRLKDEERALWTRFAPDVLFPFDGSSGGA